MCEYFVEVPRIVSLKKHVGSSNSLKDKRMQRLFDILGDVDVSKEFIDGYLEYFDHGHPRRGNLSLTEESLIEMYKISELYPQLTSESIRLIMGEYVKDLFDKVQPLSYFDGMTLQEKEDSFDTFFSKLKSEGLKSDEYYEKEAKKFDSLISTYGKPFVQFLQKCAVRYHKTFEQIMSCIPEASVVKKDVDKFFEVASKELFGYSSDPYAFKMCESMIVYGDILGYENQKLMYSSSLLGDFESPMTSDEFLKSIEEKKKKIFEKK